MTCGNNGIKMYTAIQNFINNLSIQKQHPLNFNKNFITNNFSFMIVNKKKEEKVSLLIKKSLDIFLI